MALSPSRASRSAAEPAEGGNGAAQPDAASADAPSGGAGEAGPAVARPRIERVPGPPAPAATGAPAPPRTPPAAPGPAEEQGADSAARRRPRGRAPRRPSGRERHDEKITVYVSAEELMDLEHARLVLRGEHGLAVDRGRVVREAIAVVLADLEQRGEASILVRRLRGR
ncbi:hypothetical protein OG455_10795 [Kitasatospora sp. NBC_01287]|uniref:hypothetical protein n=1 Tax=Kitasatospora sp. NBC_01287 TaxID=2903573 RepID=UPI0022590BBC|nr:hypothetical protein [Kitasatospora sp. NBC_01287]MCX4746005.1 hypothetical protein [Kitasatospora sp. NBC_01287]